MFGRLTRGPGSRAGAAPRRARGLVARRLGACGLRARRLVARRLGTGGFRARRLIARRRAACALRARRLIARRRGAGGLRARRLIARQRGARGLRARRFGAWRRRARRFHARHLAAPRVRVVIVDARIHTGALHVRAGGVVHRYSSHLCPLKTNGSAILLATRLRDINGISERISGDIRQGRCYAAPVATWSTC